MSESTTAYVPGVCNINTAETSQRRRIGHVGLFMFVILLVIFVATGLDRWIRLILIVPAILSASGYLQARNHFCVGYAGAGMQNADDGSDSALKIIEQAAIAKDKKRASTMNRQSFAIGVVAGLLTLAIPVLS